MTAVLERIREHAVHAEAEELQKFVLRIAVVVGREIFVLVAEGEDMDEQPGRMGIGDEAGRRLGRGLWTWIP